MRKWLMASTALVFLGSVGTAAEAEELKQGLYLSFFGGANWIDNIDDNDFCEASDCNSYVAEHDIGVVLGGTLGYRTAPVGPGHIRGEVEVAYRHDARGEVSYFEDEVPCNPSEGGCPGMDMSALSFMGNLWYDLPVTDSWSVFAGGGLGAARVEGKNFVQAFNFVAFEASGFPDDTDWVFAYQVGAGVTYQLPSGAELSAEYRYFATADPSFEFFEAGFADHVHAEYQTHSAMINLRIPF